MSRKIMSVITLATFTMAVVGIADKSLAFKDNSGTPEAQLWEGKATAFTAKITATKKVVRPVPKLPPKKPNVVVKKPAPAKAKPVVAPVTKAAPAKPADKAKAVQAVEKKATTAVKAAPAAAGTPATSAKVTAKDLVKSAKDQAVQKAQVILKEKGPVALTATGVSQLTTLAGTIAGMAGSKDVAAKLGNVASIADGMANPQPAATAATETEPAATPAATGAQDKPATEPAVTTPPTAAGTQDKPATEPAATTPPVATPAPADEAAKPTVTPSSYEASDRLKEALSFTSDGEDLSVDGEEDVEAIIGGLFDEYDQLNNEIDANYNALLEINKTFEEEGLTDEQLEVVPIIIQNIKDASIELVEVEDTIRILAPGALPGDDEGVAED